MSEPAMSAQKENICKKSKGEKAVPVHDISHGSTADFMKIKVTIEETLRREVEVDGVASVAEAVRKVQKGYAAEEYVLGAEDHVGTEIHAAKGDVNRIVVMVESGLLCRILASDPKLDVTIVDRNVQQPDAIAEYVETKKALESQIEAGILHVIK